ncbi:MAG: hypothetical protein ACK4TP_05075 [Hyphomicrobium sp.]|jgi:hypothetical protein
MMRTSFVALPLAVAVLSVATISTAEAGCRRAGGVATMVTKDLAVFMANAALKNSIADHGERPAGPVQLKCTDDTLTTTCTARRMACK